MPAAGALQRVINTGIARYRVFDERAAEASTTRDERPELARPSDKEAENWAGPLVV